MDLNSMNAYCKATNYNLKNRTNEGISSLDLVYGVILDHCSDRLLDVKDYLFSSKVLAQPGIDYSSVDPVVTQANQIMIIMSQDLSYQDGMTR